MIGKMMNFGNQLIFFFSALGTFNAIMLALYFFFLNKEKYLTNYLLGALLLFYSIRTGTMLFVYFDSSTSRIFLQLGLSACFFIGPFVYLFLKAAVGTETSLTRSGKGLLIAHLIGISAAGIVFPYQQYPDFWDFYICYAIYFQWFIFIIASGFTIRVAICKLFTKRNFLVPREGMLLMIYTANLLIFAFYLLSLFRTPYTSCLNGSLVFSFTIYLAISILLYRRKTGELFNFLPDKTILKKIDVNVAHDIMTKLEKLMAEEKPFLEPDLKLNDLAKMIKMSPHQLSFLLNKHLDNNFTTYINNLRINEACVLMMTDQRLTLEAVGYEVGFNSKSTFFAAFKKHTGMTPSAYQRLANIQ